MNQVSSAATGAVTIGAASLIPIITWILHGCPVGQIPEDLPYLIASAILTGGHYLLNRFNSPSDSAPPAPPQAPQPTEGIAP
jgi:hypothetical protein